MVSLTLVVPALPIHILCQAAHVRKIEYHSVKASLLDLLPSSAAFRDSRFSKLGCVNPVPHYAVPLCFESGDIGGCLWVFASELGDLIVARRDQMRAMVGAEKGFGEGEVAFADEEDAVGRGERNGWGWRFRAICELAQRRSRFGSCS